MAEQDLLTIAGRSFGSRLITGTGGAANLAVREGVQMHGGIGMTDEYDVGFYLKRARVLEASVGSSGWLKDRFAKLSDY